jgi:hypothetical protein
MEDDVELAATERAQVPHVGPQVVELGTATSRETPHRRELAGRYVYQGRGGAELGEEDRVPAAPAGEGKHAFSLEVDALERAIGDAIEKAAFTSLCSRRVALRARVRDTCLREPLPHALVMRTDFVHRDPLCHAEIVAA